MQNVDHAVRVLGDMIRQPGLALNEDDHFELVFEDALSVDFVKVSDTELEMSAQLTKLDGDLSQDKLIGLLTANYHGHGTGAGRVALDPRDQRVLLCERLDVSTLEARDLEMRVFAFIRRVLFWETDGAELVRNVIAQQAGAPAGGDDFQFIRI